eukprot:CAMPEP_0185169390 /NCGR_PEP_ID=MMETSP1139-20130426/17202_1 /TAXON_ID=298111 /ORGANISM="Pavlova sp., Strain CCMP459" /LENGTH=242 /DNA_ID=CAMNT_0027734925 /DNA_START=26 /DNA_END=750 /DNA_ORIENTATION=+
MGKKKVKAEVVARTLNALDDRIAALERELEEIEHEPGHEDCVQVAEADDASPLAHITTLLHNPPKTPESAEDKAARKERKRKIKELKRAQKAASVQPADLFCSVCKVRVNSEQLMHEHRAGRKHRELEVEQRALAENRWCAVCKLEFTSSLQLEEHEKGKRHKDAVEAQSIGRQSSRGRGTRGGSARGGSRGNGMGPAGGRSGGRSGQSQSDIPEGVNPPRSISRGRGGGGSGDAALTVVER